MPLAIFCYNGSMVFKKESKPFLLIVTFFSGLAVMAMEISGSRLLAPYFGTSLLVWTSIIGVVLAALSTGYYLGGKLAEKKPHIDLILRLLLFTGLFFLLVPLILGPLISFLSPGYALGSVSFEIFLGSALVSIVLFGLPLIILAMVNPFIIKIYSLHDNQIGNIVGSVSAVSTVGSLLGTFLPTLWTIPAYGTKITIFSFAFALIIIGLTSLKKPVAKVAVLLLAVLPMLYGTKEPHDRFNMHTIYTTESPYAHIKVEEDSTKNRYLIFNNFDAFQSIYNPKKILYGTYTDYYPLLPYLIKNESKKILIIGSAGGTISRGLKHFWGNEINIDAVEIDKKVIDIANKFFDLASQNINVINQDGLIYIKKTQEKYDLVVVDAYQNSLYMPWNLTTQEFWQLLEKRLQPHGILAININSSSPNSEFLESIVNTHASVFKYTYLTKDALNGTFNYMLISSNSFAINFSLLKSQKVSGELRGLGRILAGKMLRVNFDKNKRLLTNDKAPTDYLATKMFFQYNRKR